MIKGKGWKWGAPIPTLDPKTGCINWIRKDSKYTLRLKLILIQSKAFIVVSAIETGDGSLLVGKMLKAFDEKQEFIVDDKEQEFTVDDFATSNQSLFQVLGPATLVLNEIKASLGRKPITMLTHWQLALIAVVG